MSLDGTTEHVVLKDTEPPGEKSEKGFDKSVKYLWITTREPPDPEVRYVQVKLVMVLQVEADLEVEARLDGYFR